MNNQPPSSYEELMQHDKQEQEQLLNKLREDKNKDNRTQAMHEQDISFNKRWNDLFPKKKA